MTAPARSRGWQLRRDLRFVWSVVAQIGGLALTSTALALVLWTFLPMVAGYRPNLVTSNSMTPLISAGDVVLTHPIDRADLRPGQVVLVDDPDRPEPLLHRLKRVEGDDLVTQGDANPTPDTPSSGPVEVVGIGRMLVPAVGTPVLLAGRHPELLAIAGGAALVGIGSRVARRSPIRS